MIYAHPVVLERRCTIQIRSLLILLGPGLLVAATGVGAGDLATAAFTGGKLGTAVLWAVAVGAFFKFILNEGIGRWQVATGTTLLEGAMRSFGLPFALFFLPFLLFWSFFVGAALMGACGVAAHALFPVFEDARTAKIVFGLAHSVAGAALVWAGGFRLFERVMQLCIGMMFVTVVVTAFWIQPGLATVLEGLFVPRIPQGSEEAAWILALIGGVGGTLTILCYSYWLEESAPVPGDPVRRIRIDLAMAYGMTAVFGMAMVIIGSAAPVPEGGGATLIVNLGAHLGGTLGSPARWLFLVGAWGAVFSSLLGVWQCVPMLFAHSCSLIQRHVLHQPSRINPRGGAWYYGFLIAIAVLPALGLPYSFETVQKIYAIVGALFLPVLAAVLLWLTGVGSGLAQDRRNPWWINILLVVVLVFFAGIGWGEIAGTIREFAPK